MDEITIENIALAYTHKTSTATEIEDFLKEYQSNLEKIKSSEADEWMF